MYSRKLYRSRNFTHFSQSCCSASSPSFTVCWFSELSLLHLLRFRCLDMHYFGTLVSELLFVGWLWPLVILDIHKIMGVCYNLILFLVSPISRYRTCYSGNIFWSANYTLFCWSKPQDGAIAVTEENRHWHCCWLELALCRRCGRNEIWISFIILEFICMNLITYSQWNDWIITTNNLTFDTTGRIIITPGLSFCCFPPFVVC